MEAQRKSNIEQFQEVLTTMKESSILNSVDLENIEKILGSSYNVSPTRNLGSINENDLTKSSKINKQKLSQFLQDESNRSLVNQKIQDSLAKFQHLLSPQKEQLTKNFYGPNTKQIEDGAAKNLNKNGFGDDFDDNHQASGIIKEIDQILKDLDFSDADSVELSDKEDEQEIQDPQPETYNTYSYLKNDNLKDRPLRMSINKVPDLNLSLNKPPLSTSLNNTALTTSMNKPMQNKTTTPVPIGNSNSPTFANQSLVKIQNQSIVPGNNQLTKVPSSNANIFPASENKNISISPQIKETPKSSTNNSQSIQPNRNSPEKKQAEPKKKKSRCEIF